MTPEEFNQIEALAHNVSDGLDQLIECLAAHGIELPLQTNDEYIREAVADARDLVS